jgi:Ca-activated chloride channel family protein
LIEEIDRLPQDNEKAINELVSELLNLSKRYGILTPYTSFLALEDQKIGNNMILAQNTRQNLTKLQDVVGSTANYQRQNKEDLLMSQAPMAAMPSAVMKSESSAVDQFVASSKAQMIAPKLLADKAFFLKDGQMVDGSLTDEDMKNLKTIKRFSQEYYALAEKLGPGRLSWLSQVEPTVFNYSRVNYLIAD